MDIRLKQLSYSSLLTAHACLRKYQLYKLRATAQLGSDEEERKGSLTFAFGHAVGTGVQEVFLGYPIEQIIWNMFCNWDVDLFEENPKQKKSFWLAVIAVQKFIAMRNAGHLKDYEIVIHDGKPAVELGFCISFPDGFKYRGSVDAVLRHRITGKIVVLEVKTTSFTNLNPAMYKNSSQAVGYSVVLDKIFPELSSYEVFYLPYKTKDMEWDYYPFPKSYLQRALWIQELLLDIEFIKSCETVGVYPMRGESCLDFYRECEYYGICTLSTENLTQPLTEQMEAQIEAENAEYQIQLTIQDLIHSQLDKVGT